MWRQRDTRTNDIYNASVPPVRVGRCAYRPYRPYKPYKAYKAYLRLVIRKRRSAAIISAAVPVEISGFGDPT